MVPIFSISEVNIVIFFHHNCSHPALGLPTASGDHTLILPFRVFQCLSSAPSRYYLAHRLSLIQVENSATTRHVTRERNGPHFWLALLHDPDTRGDYLVQQFD